MRLLHKELFEFEHKSYEIRIYSEGWRFTVRAYLDGSPVNGYKYTVDLPTAFDLHQIQNIDAIQRLFELAKEDIQSRIWERFVTIHLRSMRTTAKDILGCQNCTSRNIVSTMVDGSKMFECQDCSNIWYERPSSAGACQIVLDQIIGEIEKTGSHETFTVALLNGPFTEDKSVGPSFMDQLQNWTNKNKLRYEFFQKRDSDGKRREAIRFYSEVPRVPPPILA
ncbi:MAG: hypothetical protein A2Y76_05205 [Planctomycetes bacterium RBG_13_60_9]|nr:MAG: hypothetical protein A2Y76_05205 [Planctomycetes bacterium RBG_13_60_9]